LLRNGGPYSIFSGTWYWADFKVSFFRLFFGHVRL
jgi:hypothetical protein